MTYAFFYGLLTGFLLSIMLGTVFFCLVQNSITNGFKSGLYVATGVIISDMILIVLSYFNATIFPKGGTTELIVRIAGATFLLFMAYNNLFNKKQVLFPNADVKNPLLLGSKGFMLNILNPANYLSWLAVAATLTNVLHFTYGERWLYYAGALSAIFGMEMLISYGASGLKKFISPTFLLRLDMVLGILFIVFSLLLLKPLLFGK